MEKIDKQVILDYHEALGQIWEQYEKLNRETKNRYRTTQYALEDAMAILEKVIYGTTQNDVIEWLETLKNDENYNKKGVIKND